LVAPLFHVVLGQYRLDPGSVHGVGHWGRVLENGRRLAGSTRADLDVLELFAIFHDACRRSDGRDRDHGPRAAELVTSLRARIDLDDAQFALLVEACHCHTRGPARGAHTTVLTCLDSDRLDIPRVGMRVNPTYLSTRAARDWRMIAWASGRASNWAFPAVCREEWDWDRG
jgi:uncharacterized protein